MSRFSESDEILVARLREGDLAAFRRLYARFWQRLYDHARQKTGDDAVAAEVVQDVFVRLWERRAALDIAQLEGYLFMAVRYALISHWRQRLVVRQRGTDLPLPAEMDGDMADAALYAADVQEAFERALCGLPDKTRDIFSLSRLEGLPHRQIAARLQITEKAVEYHITQALKVMRDVLKSYWPMP